MAKLYGIRDVVTNKFMFVAMAENDRDVVRQLVNMNFFKIYRLMDIELIKLNEDVETMANSWSKKLNLKAIIEGLAYEIEDKAKEIKGTEREVADKIKAKVDKKEINDVEMK